MPPPLAAAPSPRALVGEGRKVRHHEHPPRQARHRRPPRPCEPGRGDAATRSRRRAHPHHPALPGLGRGRRVQRGPRPQALLRPAHGGGLRLRGQPRGSPAPGPDLPGRRGPDPRPLGARRRGRPHGPQRSQLHRAGLRRPRRPGLLRSRSHRGLPAGPGRHRLGRDLRRIRGPVAPHRRDLRRPLRDHPGGGPGGDDRRPRPRRPRLLRPELPAVPVEEHRRQGEGP